MFPLPEDCYTQSEITLKRKLETFSFHLLVLTELTEYTFFYYNFFLIKES